MNLYLIENDQSIELIFQDTNYQAGIDHIVCLNFLPYYVLQKQASNHSFSFIEDWFSEQDYEELHLQTDLFAKNWYQTEGKDISLFEGISYGKIVEHAFSKYYLAGILVKYGELVRKIIEKYTPQHVFFDLSNQFNTFYYWKDDGEKFFNKEKTIRIVAEQLGFSVRQIVPKNYIPSAFESFLYPQNTTDWKTSLMTTLRSFLEKFLNVFAKKNDTYFFAYFNINHLLDFSPEKLIIPNFPLNKVTDTKFLFSGIKFFDLNQSDPYLDKKEQVLGDELMKSIEKAQELFHYRGISYQAVYQPILKEIVKNQILPILKFGQAFRRNVKQLKIKKLIFPAISHEKAQLIYEICRKEGVKSILVDHGIQGNHYFSRETLRLSEPDLSITPSEFDPYGLQCPNIALGNPVTDLYPAKKRKTIKNIKKVLFLTFEDNFYCRFDRFMYQEAYLKEVCQTIPYLLEKGIEVYYKPHHENRKYHEYIFDFFGVDMSKINYVEGFGFSKLIYEMDLMVCNVSSCFYEAQLAGVPTIFLEPKKVGNALHPPLYSENSEEVIWVQKSEELINIIDRNKDNAQELALFLSNFLEKYAPKYLGKLENSASEKIMTYLNQLT